MCLFASFYDDIESGDDDWVAFNLDDGMDFWSIADDLSASGEKAWFVPNAEVDNDQVLVMLEPITITGDQPVLSFQHYYSTEWGFDGGFVEVSTDNVTWRVIPAEQFFRNGYRATLIYQFGIPDLPIFAGVSDENFQFRPVYADMSEYIGEDVFIRFRFASDGAVGGLGWYVDDIEFMDMLNYNGEVCVTSAEGDNACAIADSRGTIVSSDVIINTEEVTETHVGLSVQPNPANHFINISIVNDKVEEVNISLVTVDGKEVVSQKVNTYKGQQTVLMDIAALAKGFYFVRLSTDKTIATEKIIIE